MQPRFEVLSKQGMWNAPSLGSATLAAWLDFERCATTVAAFACRKRLVMNPNFPDGSQDSRARNSRLKLTRSLMSAEHQGFDRQQQRLDPKQHRVHKSDRVDRMKPESLKKAEIL